MGSLKLWLACVVVFHISDFCVQAADIVIYTEHYPPYNYLDDAGKPSGLATENVRQVLDESGLSYEIQVIPWGRAVARVKAADNALLYSMVRVPSREDAYRWLVPLAASGFHLYARGDDPQDFTSEGLKSGHYSAVCHAQDITCEMLKLAGVPDNKLHKIPDGGTGDFRMVYLHRADLFVSEPTVSRRLRLLDGLDPSVVRPVMRIGQASDFYLAGAQNFDAGFEEKIGKAYKRLVKAGRYHVVAADVE